MPLTRMDNLESLGRLAGSDRVDHASRRGLSGTYQLDRYAQQYLYRNYGILKKLVDIPANQMTFRWGALQLGGDDGDVKIRDEFDRITSRGIFVKTLYNKRVGLSTAFNLAMKAAYKTGNGAILLDVDDGQSLDKPINFNRLRRINALYVLNRWTIFPLRVGAITDDEFFQLGGVAASRLGIVDQYAGLQVVHRSRVLWFRGDELDDEELASSQGCDDSVFQSKIESFFRYIDAVCGSAAMMKDFDVLIHKVGGLLAEFEKDGDRSYEAFVRRRVEINDDMSRLHRTRIIDLENEDLVHSSRAVAGYADLFDRIMDDFLANCELTPSELFGKYPKGMADTGKVEQQNANDRTARYQFEKFYSNIMEFCRILFQCKEQSPTGGKLPDDFDFVFQPLYPVTPVEQAELELIRAQIDDVNIRNQVYYPDDAAKSHYSNSEYQNNIIIDWPERDRIKAEKEAQEKKMLEGQMQMAKAQLQGKPPAKQLPPAGQAKTDSLSFLPPQQVVTVARDALDARRQGKIRKGQTMLLLSSKIARGDVLDLEDIRSMHQFFILPKSRRDSKQSLTEGKGAIAWAMYGGDLGASWAAAISREVDRRFIGDVRGDAVDDPQFDATDDPPISVKGSVLSNKQWEAIATVDEATAEAALTGWKQSAPNQFTEVLEAGNP